MNRILVIFAFTLVSGCTFTHNIDIKPNLSLLPKLSEVNKSEISAGIYYSPQFVDEKITHVNGEHIFVAPIGTASVQYFDDLFSRIFSKTTRISHLDPNEINDKGIDIVIAPTLGQLDFKMQSFQADKDWHITSYRITLYNKQAVPVASWIVSGKNALKGLQGYGGMIENGMTDAAIMFLQGFEKDAGPSLITSSKKQSDSTYTIDPKNISLSASRSFPQGFDSKKSGALLNAGVIAIKVMVYANNERKLIVRESDMRLHLSNKKILEPSSISSILGNLEETSHAQGATAALLGPIALLTMASEVTSNDARREAELKAANQYLFQEKVLEKDKEKTGFVFFTLPKGAKEDSIQALSVWVVDPAHAEGVQIEAALPNQQNTCNKANSVC